MAEDWISMDAMQEVSPITATEAVEAEAEAAMEK